MIHAIIGELIEVSAQSAIVRTSCGVEYELAISSQTASRLSQLHKEAKGEIRLLSYLHHKEDGMTLFGFSDSEERMLFLELIKVSGIGPKQALKILGGVQVRAFVKALDESDITFLSSIPGIGQKTSQKIILALRDTIILTPSSPKGAKESAETLDRKYHDLVAALNDMGYDRRQVVGVISQLLDEHHDLVKTKSIHEVEEFLFRKAIIALG